MQIAPRKELSLFDSTCIIVGIIIDAGIYQMALAIAEDRYCCRGVQSLKTGVL